MSYIVRYPSDEDDEGQNYGPFTTREAAEEYRRAHPSDADEWNPYVVELKEPK